MNRGIVFSAIPQYGADDQPPHPHDLDRNVQLFHEALKAPARRDLAEMRLSRVTSVT